MKAGIFFGGGSLIALHAGYSSGPLKPIALDRVYGVSAGSLWATLLGFLGVDEGLKILGTIQKNSDIFCTKDTIALAGDLAFRAGDGFILGYTPLRALLAKYITGKPSIPVTVGRVQNNTMKLQHVTAYPDGTFDTDNDGLGTVTTLEEFLDATCSSCLTYPIVDMLVDKNGKFWQDGGFREGGPVVKAILDGATELHVCLTGMFCTDCNFDNTTGGDPINCLTRTLEGMANQNVVGSVNDAIEDETLSVFVYEANPQGSSQVFDQKDIQANIEIGSKVVAVKGVDLKILD